MYASFHTPFEDVVEVVGASVSLLLLLLLLLLPMLMMLLVSGGVFFCVLDYVGGIAGVGILCLLHAD